MIHKVRLWSRREEIGSLTQKFRKSYVAEKNAEWDKW